MNYTGGKYSLLGTILPMFPDDIDTFVDLFAGGLNVGINVEASKIYANDQITYLVELYQLFKDVSTEEIINEVEDTIKKYNLSKTNVEGYIDLRNDYNENKRLIDLFVLTCFSFNHQIRFNSKHEFNTPFGKERSSYNDSIKNNLIRFCEAIKEKDIILSSQDFLEFDYSILKQGDLIYCDPPYLISTGSYNDGKRGFKDWSKKEEEELLTLLSDLDNRGVKFALSNVFYHKGLENDLLIKWADNYNVNFLNKEYSNCNYHVKNRDSVTVEVLVTNY